mmetsp:Transcript_7850/g.11965  ORF Transcript_7850/g.11965 Transcript_7850/m.11965 type:complete len:247 (-) Transcript_7850:299-1039(-)
MGELKMDRFHNNGLRAIARTAAILLFLVIKFQAIIAFCNDGMISSSHLSHKLTGCTINLATPKALERKRPLSLENTAVQGRSRGVWLTVRGAGGVGYDMLSDPVTLIYFVGVAGAVIGASALMFTVSQGEYGLNKYLSEGLPEQRKKKPRKAWGEDGVAPLSPPPFLSSLLAKVPLPDVDFVDVYGQPQKSKESLKQVLEQVEQLQSLINKSYERGDDAEAQRLQKNLMKLLEENNIKYTIREGGE